MPFVVTTKRPGPKPKPFWAYVDKSGDCWIWIGGRSSEGYGSFSRDGRSRPAHILAYEEAHGPTPEGLELDHTCRNRACVNPAHLEPVTHRVNTLRGEGPTARHARKTHCPAGHTYDSESRGRRVCLTCKREKMREYRARKAA
jgi:hypothetical protein